MGKYSLPLLIIVAIAVAAGFVIDQMGFFVNLLADVVSTVVGIWVAVVIVETILRQQRSHEWTVVRNATYRALQQTMVSVALVFNSILRDTSFLPEIIEIYESPDSGRGDVLTRLLSALRNLERVPSKPELRALYEECLPELKRIRGVILPSTISVGQDLELLQLLQGLDSAIHRWDVGFIRDQLDGVTDRYLFDCSLDVLSSFATIQIYMSEDLYVVGTSISTGKSNC